MKVFCQSIKIFAEWIEIFVKRIFKLEAVNIIIEKKDESDNDSLIAITKHIFTAKSLKQDIFHVCLCQCHGYIYKFNEMLYFCRNTSFIYLILFQSTTILFEKKSWYHEFMTQLNLINIICKPEEWENHVRDSMFFFAVGMDHCQWYQPFLKFQSVKIICYGQ